MTQNSIDWLAGRFAYFLGQDTTLTKLESSWVLQSDSWPGDVIFPHQFAAMEHNASELPFTLWQNKDIGQAFSNCLPMPGVVGQVSEPYFEGANLYFNYDLPGLVYWCLTRQEELTNSGLDAHGRFPARESHAYKHGYLDRPIVDEWFLFLSKLLAGADFKVKYPKVHEPMIVSHDVDRPSRYGFDSWITDLKRARYDVFHSSRKWTAVKSILTFKNAKLKLPADDPFNTFEWIMAQSEQRSLKSLFFFFGGSSNIEYDASYTLSDPSIGQLVAEIVSRGHDFGIHPSYDVSICHNLLEQQAKEIIALRRQHGLDGSLQGRMHYLRWNSSSTPKVLSQSGVVLDHTLGYADQAGFRCGTCHQYPYFDSLSDRCLPLKIQPLVAMEESVINPQYMNARNADNAFRILMNLKERTRAVSGTFTLLWHNSSLVNQEHRDIYCSVMDA